MKLKCRSFSVTNNNRDRTTSSISPSKKMRPRNVLMDAAIPSRHAGNEIDAGAFIIDIKKACVLCVGMADLTHVLTFLSLLFIMITSALYPVGTNKKPYLFNQINK